MLEARQQRNASLRDEAFRVRGEARAKKEAQVQADRDRISELAEAQAAERARREAMMQTIAEAKAIALAHAVAEEKALRKKMAAREAEEAAIKAEQ